MHCWCTDDALMMHSWCASVIVFDILESSSFQKYSICHVFCAVWWYDDHHMIIWWSSYEDMMMMTRCQDHILTENIWFVWSRTSYSWDKWRCNGCGTNDKQGKIGLLSLLTVGRLSFAINSFENCLAFDTDYLNDQFRDVSSKSSWDFSFTEQTEKGWDNMWKKWRTRQKW